MELSLCFCSFCTVVLTPSGCEFCDLNLCLLMMCEGQRAADDLLAAWQERL